MSIEVDLVTFLSKTAAAPSAQPGALVPLQTPNAVVKGMRQFFQQASPPPAPAGSLLKQFHHYRDLAVAAYLSLPPKVKGAWQLLTAGAVPSVDNGHGQWDPYPSASLRVLPAGGAVQLNALGAEVHHFVSVHPPIDPHYWARECTFCFVNTTGRTAGGLVVFLTHTRTKILDVIVPGGTAAPLVRGDATVGRVDPPAAVAPGEKLCFTVRFHGDPPFFRARTWLVDGARDEAPPPAPFATPPAAVVPGAAAQLAGYARTLRDEIEHRVELVAADKSPDRPFREFFLELDRSTNPANVEDEGERAEYALLGGYLSRRFLIRAERVHLMQPGATPTDPFGSWLPVAAAVAGRLRSLFEAHFGDGQGDLDVPRFEEAFEKFAGGELGVFETHGVPNGVNYFAFGELALLLQAEGHEPDFWGPLVPVLTRTAELFAGAFHLCAGPRTACAYQAAHNLDGARAPGDAVKHHVRAAWRSADPAEEFGRVVHAALVDELGPGPQLPRDLPDFGCPGLPPAASPGPAPSV